MFIENYDVRTDTPYLTPQPLSIPLSFPLYRCVTSTLDEATSVRFHGWLRCGLNLSPHSYEQSLADLPVT